MATTTQIDPMALLAGMAQQTEKKKGGKDAKPQITEPAMDAAIAQWIEADKDQEVVGSSGTDLGMTESAQDENAQPRNALPRALSR